MKKPGTITGESRPAYKCLPIALAAAALLLTGCPHNQYIVQLQPRGDVIERTLVFYREDGVNTNTGAPNYETFDATELAAITALYPAHGLTNDKDRHTISGTFANELPGNVGGAGVYTNLTTTLGEAGFYAERFRGNDDLAGMSERRDKAADRLADLALGWSQTELGREPGYGNLRQFLDSDFRRDLKNLGAYWWQWQSASDGKTNALEEFTVRLGLYLLEHGYVTMGEIPRLLREQFGGESQAMSPWIQRLAARKMGVAAGPLPASLGFLSDDDTMEKSLTNYLAGTDAYRARLKQWEADREQKPDLQQPSAKDLLTDQIAELIPFDISGGEQDHLVVRLSLPSAPDRSNGRWDEALKQVIWDTDIVDRTNRTHLPVSCYASWSQPNESFQTEHLGKAALIGENLTDYCLWRSSLTARRGGEWDAFLAGLKPGGELVKKLDGFRFSDEPVQNETKGQPKVPRPSDHPRELIKNALK